MRPSVEEGAACLWYAAKQACADCNPPAQVGERLLGDVLRRGEQLAGGQATQPAGAASQQHTQLGDPAARQRHDHLAAVWHGGG